MDVKVRHNRIRKKIKPSLVFFCFLALLPACRQDHGTPNLVVQYKNGSATSLSVQTDTDPAEFRLFIAGEEETPVLGEIVSSDKGILFIPAIPFQPGRSYHVYREDQKVGDFSIAEAEGRKRPQVSRFYPTTDSVPENLLKVYVQFSMPMQEVGNALDFIEVRDVSEGQPVDIFLRMESELWNKEHNLLTLWLDPGRIKTGLIPNMAKGLPLKAGHSYAIRISPEWKSATGLPLEEGYEKTFHVGIGDRSSPDPGRWELQSPKGNTRDPLKLVFPEPLDAVLLPECLQIRDREDGDVIVHYRLGPLESSIEIIPSSAWNKEEYTLLIDPKLEDLAGNNLWGLFDEKIREGNPVPREVKKGQLQFTVK